jgi:hypothetical protein
MSKITKTGQKICKIPVIFPVLREFDGKEWGLDGISIDRDRL